MVTAQNLHRRLGLLAVFTLVLVLSCLLYLRVGAVETSWMQLWRGFFLTGNDESHTVLNFRLPRLLCVILVGTGLAMSGAALQTLFRNPLADPSLLGISSGAALATALLVLFSGTNLYSFFFWQPITAFIGSLACVITVYSIAAHRQDFLNPAVILLSGIALNALAAAGIGFFILVSDSHKLQGFMFWMMGSFADADWEHLIGGIFIIPSLTVLWLLSKSLDLLAMGEQNAYHAGCSTGLVKTCIILSVAFAVGCGTAMAGIVSFIGLIAPHISRLIIGGSHKFFLAGSGLCGAVLLVWSDLAARTVIAPAELALGVVTAAIGAPFFLCLLLYRH